MPIALETGRDSIQRRGFIREMPCNYGDSPEVFDGDRRFPVREGEDSESCSSSSIGRNSDSSDKSSDGEDSGENEVQSEYKGPLDTMDALEDVLPVKRGISKFYNGKSKSFTSLADASSISSIKELAKPDNPYNRKRKNLLASNRSWGQNRTPLPRGSSSSSFSKGPASSYWASSSTESSELSSSSSSSPSRCLPPRHPQQARRLPNNVRNASPPRRNFCSIRSFSLSDLHCVTQESQ